jgi:SPP1 family holin
MDKMAIIRLVLMLVANVNAILASKGYATIPVLDEATIAIVLAFVINLWGLFKHNFFGKNAKAKKETLDRVYNK